MLYCRIAALAIHWGLLERILPLSDAPGPNCGVIINDVSTNIYESLDFSLGKSLKIGHHSLGDICSQEDDRSFRFGF